MRVNKKLLPLKAHYFCFLGCVSPILPFLVVFGQQLGIPVTIMGTVGAVSLLLVVLMKPVMAALADTYPSYRRIIFLINLSVMVITFSCLSFVSPMQGQPRVQGQLEQVIAERNGSIDGGNSDGLSLRMTTLNNEGQCYVSVAWDCVARCEETWRCLNSTTMTTQSFTLTLSHLTGEGVPHISTSLGLNKEEKPHKIYYEFEGAGVPDNFFPGNLSIECGSGQWEGDGCPGVWSQWQFWMFVLLLFIGQIAFNTAISVTDAIIVDKIGKDGDYGIQRAWGTVGWGLMGPVSGLLVDWMSGTNVTKNYTPAFLICLILGGSDVFLSAVFIKVPKITTEHNVLEVVWPVIKHPRFFVFCLFVIFNGAFDGLVGPYLLMMQENMAKGTSTMNYMKFLQGMTIFVQCGIEAPFMFINNWFMRKMGAHYVTSLVFFLYIFRLLGLAAVGAYGPVWATLVVEILNGPCYGLGYTAIVVYSSKLSPPGTSTTVQSVVNICYESLGYAAASFFGGQLFSNFGGPGLYLIAGITAAVIFILHLLSLKLLPPPKEHNDKEDSIEKKPVGEEEGPRQDSQSESSDEGSALAGKVKEQDTVEMT